jgi:hypothetical protein
MSKHVKNISKNLENKSFADLIKVSFGAVSGNGSGNLFKLGLVCNNFTACIASKSVNF